MSILTTGMRFSSYEDFQAALNNYKIQSCTEFTINYSKTLESIKLKSDKHEIKNAPMELRYYVVNFTCVHGGSYRKNKISTGLRNTSSMKMNCPALITLKLSEDGKCLVVDQIIEHHNHMVSRELFQCLPSQRKLDPKDQEEIARLLELKANKKLVQEKYSALTQKNITLRDLSNLAAKAKSKKAEFKNIIEDTAPNVEVHVVPERSNLTTSQKFRKAQVMTNKLAMLMSESPFFQEQLSFLQTVYDSWANGKVSLEIRNKDPTDLSPATHLESLSGLIPNRSLTEASTSSGLQIEKRDNASVSLPACFHLPSADSNATSSNYDSLSHLPVEDSNASALNVILPSIVKVRGRPKGMRTTAIGLPLKKRRKTVPVPTPSTASHKPTVVKL